MHASERPRSTADPRRTTNHPRRSAPPSTRAELLELQRTAGNRAVTALIASRPEAVQRRGDAAAGQGSTASLLARLTGINLGEAAVRALVALGVRSENDLTNLLFWVQHPEAALRKIGPDEKDLAAAWVRIRDTVVRPALAKSAGTGGTGTPEKPAPTPTGGEKPGPTPTGGEKPVPAAGGKGGIGPERLGKYLDADATTFRRQVYRRQLARAKRKKEFYPGIPAGDLQVVEGGHKLHRTAAGDAKDLFAAARRDLDAAQQAGDPLALKVSSIGIGSAYRDPERDFRAWQNAFNTHYNATAKTRAGMAGGAHGEDAVSLMVSRMVTKKAVPGFSNHTKGLAIDFSTKQGKWTFGASSAQSAGWVKTWLYQWLAENAGSFNFHPYEAEEWHWDHRS